MNGPTQETRVTLYRGWSDPGKYVWSPFVTKLEARLRFSGLKYTTDSGSPKTAPKGKIPYVECRGHFTDCPFDSEFVSQGQGHESEDVARIGDSSLIIRGLTQWGLVPDLNSGVDYHDRTLDLTLRALLEDKLYFYHTKERWMDNYYTMRDHTLWAVPYPLRIIVGMIVQRRHTAMLHGQGTGRFSNEELAQFKSEIWQTLNDKLNVSRIKADKEGLEGPFWILGGSHPTEADATLFGFIVSVLVCSAGPDSQKIVRGLPGVMDYAARIHNVYFPDYEKWPEL